MPIQYSNNWEVKWYGDVAKFPLIQVAHLNRTVTIYYRTYLAALESRCEVCGKQGENVQIRSQNTAYTDEYKNYACFCQECQAEANTYWQERWDDYYAEIRGGLY